MPEITPLFWVIKAMSTAMGEATSDYFVHAMAPVVAVFIGFIGFLVAIWLQLSRRRYVAWAYWLAVVMVGVFGTMAADVLHVGFHLPYFVSSVLYAICLAAVFISWDRSEGTLSIHTVDSLRREGFYWSAVVTTFAVGTAVGDLSAITFHLGYLHSGLLFAALILVPVVCYLRFQLNAVATFWTAYVLTRPLGASFADYVGKPKSVGGLGVGDGPVCLVLLVAIIVLVAVLSITKIDVQGRESATTSRHGTGQ